MPLNPSPLDWEPPELDHELFQEQVTPIPPSARLLTLTLQVAQGFLVLDVVPPEQLGPLRASFEALVERQRAVWTAEAEAAGTPDPWETGAQPRLPAFDRLVDDSQTADAMEFCLGATTRGVCKRLMRADEVGNVAFFLMCSPQTDHGPAHWHRAQLPHPRLPTPSPPQLLRPLPPAPDTHAPARAHTPSPPPLPPPPPHAHAARCVAAGDIHPIDQGPLGGLQKDMLDNHAPGYIQWNISLYDDDVLWVIPGSHARANTAAENAQLEEDNRAPMPGAVQVKLRAGQGVCCE